MIDLVNYKKDDGFSILGKPIGSNVIKTTSTPLSERLSGWWNGEAPKKLEGIPSIDDANNTIGNWQTDFKNGSTIQEIIDKTKPMTDADKEFLKTQDLLTQNGASYIKWLTDYNDKTSEANKSSGGFKSTLKGLGGTLVSSLANVAISTAINLIVSGLWEIVTASDAVAQKAQELGSSFQELEKDIDGYKSTISSLYDTINDPESSTVEITNARQQLLELQDEMIKGYGKEKSSIEAITKGLAKRSRRFRYRR